MTLPASDQTPPPVWPAIDEHSVWLVGDGAPPDPVRAARRLAELVQPAEEGVGDSYLFGGPVAALEARFAERLGKPACAFFPTGLLANTVALRLLAGENRRVLVPHESHLYRDEGDAAQTLSGLNLVPMAPGRPGPTPDEVREMIEASAGPPYPVPVGAVALESPVRRMRQRMISPGDAAAISAFARERGIGLHLDGARLLLAPPPFDIPAYTALFDTVYVSTYKYLEAPFGGVLAGPTELIERARTLRHKFGGTLHQGWPAAVLANAALDGFDDRHVRAHAHARELFEALERAEAAKVLIAEDASYVIELEIASQLADGLFDRLREAGIRAAKPDEAGRMLLSINQTILRRSIADYVRLFTAQP